MTFAGPLDGVDVHVELGYYAPGSDLTAWDVARWDTAPATWEGDAPLHDISCDAISVNWTQGRDQPLDRFRTGTCTVVVDDPAGALSPWSSAADPTEYAAIRPGIDLVVSVDLHDGHPRLPRFRGVVDSIVDVWPSPSPDMDPPHRVTFHALDYLQDLAAYDGYELPPVGAGELTGTRVGRIMDNAGYVRDRDLDDGTVTVQATTLARNALDEAGLTTDTERGALWCDRAGVIQFRDRNGLVSEPRYGTPQAIFGEHPENGEVCYSDVALASDAAKIRNVVTVSRAGGTATTRNDQTSIALYGRRTYRRLDLLHETDAQSPGIADAMLAVFAYAENRVTSLRVDLEVNPGDVDVLLPLDVLDMIELRRRTTGLQIVAALQIQAIAETITASKWTLDFTTFAASDVFDVARWDTAALWDTGLWGY